MDSNKPPPRPSSAPAPQRPSTALQDARTSALPQDARASMVPQRPTAPPGRGSMVPQRASRLPGGDEEGEARLGSSERTRLAGDGIRALAKASRSYLIYDPGNAAVRGFIEDVRATFERFFNAHGDMELTVRPFELMLDNEAVYLERDRERSLALKLFRDGVRKLILTRDTDWGELTRLLEILSIRFVGVRMNEDDITTLLWKAGFAHIRVEAVEGFVPDDNDDDVQVGAVGGVTQARQSAERIFSTSSARVGDVASMRVPDDFDLPMPRLPPPVRLQYLRLNDVALEDLRAETDSTQLPEATLHVVRELMEVAASPTDPLTFEETEHFVREVRDFLLAEDRMDALLVLYDDLARFRERAPAERERIDVLLSGFVDPAAVRRLIRSVPKDLAEPPERLMQLLSRVPGDVLKMFFELLESERDDHSRKIVRYLIAQRLPDRARDVVERFRASPGPVAADLLRVLTNAVPDAATQLVTQLMAGSDTEVQHEFLRLSSDMPPSSHLRGLLTMMLNATSLDVREHALETIAARGEKGAFPTLQRHAEARADAGASSNEMAAVGRAMARVDGARAFEVFKEWVEPKGFFKKLFNAKPLVARGHAALWGLSLLGTAEAAAIVQQVYTKGEAELREAARETIAASKAKAP